ncbi:hypothetical protein [Kribbella sp. NPDC049227]|uniref:hypothetical protein n=1 Tax=Kribbella sp. NPDC049227 TaxID=3364113 RepID=UPI003717C15B
MRTLCSPDERKDRFEAEATPLRPRLYVAAVRLTVIEAIAEQRVQEALAALPKRCRPRQAVVGN